MAKNSHEQLADSIVKDIMEARNEEEYDKIFYDLDALCNASKVAKGASLFETDLKRFIKEDQFYYNSEDVDKIITRFSRRVGKRVRFRTLTLYRNLENGLIENLQELQDPWETAKIVYSLGYLYFYDRDKLSRVIYKIKDNNQRRIAIIAMKAFYCKSEEVFSIFK